MQSEPTTFEETIIKNHVSLPSITFCVDTYEDNFTSFQDVMDSIEEEKIKKNAWITFYGRDIDSDEIDLKNATIVSQKLNSTIDDIWSFGATVSPYSASSIMICSSLDLSVNAFSFQRGLNQIKTETCLDRPFMIRFERHEPRQSLYNYQFDTYNGYQAFRKGIFQYNLVTPIETEALKQKSFDCYEDNSMRKSECIDEYIIQQLNCSLPWSKVLSNLEECHGDEDLLNFRRLHSQITSEKRHLELDKKGCFKPNCMQTKWKDSYVSWFKPDPNCTRIEIGIKSDSFTIQRKEILLADFSTFVVDCGSYLGLFLGASILSLTDTALAYIIKTGVSFFRK